MVVYVILTDIPSRGGGIYSVKATEEEAKETLLYLGPDAYCIPWEVGSEEWDDNYCRFIKHTFKFCGN